MRKPVFFAVALAVALSGCSGGSSTPKPATSAQIAACQKAVSDAMLAAWNTGGQVSPDAAPIQRACAPLSTAERAALWPTPSPTN